MRKDRATNFYVPVNRCAEIINGMSKKKKKKTSMKKGKHDAMGLMDPETRDATQAQSCTVHKTTEAPIVCIWNAGRA